VDISGEYRVVGDRNSVWQALHSPELLRRCIPGCLELEPLSATDYRAKVKVSIGPVSGTFDVHLSMVNASPPTSYRLEGEGRAGPLGFGKGYADVLLAEDIDFTRLNYSADFQVGGRMAQLGSRLIVGATRKIVDDFFAKLATEIGSSAGGLSTREVPRASPRFALLAAGTACLAGLAAFLWWIFR
jgi:uncharacterized protein